jgi:hypothetical protein
MEPVIIKQEGIKQQLDFHIYEHLETEPASIRQERTAYVDEYENLVNGGVVDGASAENEEEPAAMKARILTKVSKDVPLIEQERETQKLVD